MKRFGVLVAVAVLACGTATTGSARASESAPSSGSCPTAEIFATDNTAIITDPADPRLRTRLTRFDREVRSTIRSHGARPGASTLLDGVFWSAELQRATYERSRAFDVNRVSAQDLHHIADVIRKQYRQEAVLTFRCLPRDAPDTDAVEIRADGVDATRLHDALVADPEARERLGGGSVTLDEQLVLVAPLADLPLARRFAENLGVDWEDAEIRYGDEEFVG
ncbi:hypothetical protein [Streptomyces sp. WAC06614]|uniref:hypothetical protein n=1 Tax=Streptomyces sp. WAC06614 TaxID=2487416 RepID=UPI000F7BA4C5|nr:hypothetical protein [Streptomyces sp. WAC06614]RSS78925.1 hypothetical protein EF918_19215 [Streptomyces sp. WAC06614]